jgi:hypothetical protein
LADQRLQEGSPIEKILHSTGYWMIHAPMYASFRLR